MNTTLIKLLNGTKVNYLVTLVMNFLLKMYCTDFVATEEIVLHKRFLKLVVLSGAIILLLSLGIS